MAERHQLRDGSDSVRLLSRLRSLHPRVQRRMDIQDLRNRRERHEAPLHQGLHRREHVPGGGMEDRFHLFVFFEQFIELIVGRLYCRSSCQL